MKRTIRFALVAATASLAACGDSSLAPKASSSTSVVDGGGANAALTLWDTLRFQFTIDPSRKTVYPLGLGNSIVFPAGTLCDPATSSYGPGTWNDACAIASSPLTVHAKAWLDAAGHPRIDFDQHIRFAPSDDRAKWVILSFTDFRGAFLANANIGYCTSTTSACVDESTTDPSLATIANPVTGQLTRRIKHFSGYNVFAGYSCDPSTGCTSDGSSSLMSRTIGRPNMVNETAPGEPSIGKDQRQGYMLAWGRSDQPEQ